MKRDDYLRELRRSLQGIAEEEKSEIVSDYEEHFRVGSSRGKSEEEIARSLGSPRTIGHSYRIDSMLGGGEPATAASVLRAVFATTSLGFFNIVIVLGPFVALVAVMISLWAAAASIGLSGLALVLGVIAQPIFPAYISTGGFHPIVLVFAGIGLAALGVVVAIGMISLSRVVLRMVGSYVRLNVRIVKNRG